MDFKKEEINKKFPKDYFELNSLLKTTKKDEPTEEKKEEQKQEENTQEKKEQIEEPKPNSEEEKTNQTASIKDVVYPMHLPNNTYLTNQERVNTKTGERLILTFGGDSSFILVEEINSIPEESLVIPTSGEFDFLTDVIGIIDTHSLSWHSNGIDYYMASDIIETSELIDIARSINMLPVSK